MKLQIALDMLDVVEARAVVRATYRSADIFEIGTPFLKFNGVDAIEEVIDVIEDSTNYKKEIFVDLKSMDVGGYEADFAFKSGATIVSVCGAASIETIKSTIKSARANNGKVVVDMVGVADYVNILPQIEELGIDYLGIHTGIDMQLAGHSVIAGLEYARNVCKTKTPLMVAGGINEKTIKEVVRFNPEVVIVGGYITQSNNKERNAMVIKQAIEEYTKDVEVKNESNKK